MKIKKQIEFQYNWNSEYYQAIPISRFSVDSLKNPNEKVIEEKTIQYDLSYPLSAPVTITEKSEIGFTMADIIRSICNNYERIYNEEYLSSSIVVTSMEDRINNGGLLNRNGTDGKYGIWGHDIQDLVIERIYIKNTSNGIAHLLIGIGS